MSERTYAYSFFRIGELWLQVRAALRGSPSGHWQVQADRLHRDCARIEEALGRRLAGQRVLEMGAGQLMARARALAVENQVSALEPEAAPEASFGRALLELVRKNGWGRALKTLGRRLLGADQRSSRAWARALGVERLPAVDVLHESIDEWAPPNEAFDVIVSWSVFEHLRHPEQALERLLAALRPGGVFYLGIHLYTSNSGHHDLRSFKGAADAVPLWGHLRPTVSDQVRPSAYLNKLRLADWRQLFDRFAPGYSEFQERYGEEALRARLSPELRSELAGYTDEELFAVDVFFRWRKPDVAQRNATASLGVTTSRTPLQPLGSPRPRAL